MKAGSGVPKRILAQARGEVVGRRCVRELAEALPQTRHMMSCSWTACADRTPPHSDHHAALYRHAVLHCGNVAGLPI
jgi:hypothetical protein